jgi:RND family efflux transporter MFP subunit
MSRWIKARGSAFRAHTPFTRFRPAGRGFYLLFALLLAITAAGCTKKPSGAKEDEIPVIPASHPERRTVVDYAYFTGQTNSTQPTNIIARVTGYVVKTPFKEGAEVKKGDLLYVIDPRPYDAQYEQAKSQKELNDAQLALTEKTLARFEALKKSSPGSVSEQDLDQYKASVDEAKARLNAQIRSLDLYSMNKEFTQVTSPVDGQVGRYMATIGNLVNQDQTLLTTVQTLDPMFVDFYMDEATRLTIIKKIREGKLTLPPGGGLNVQMGLQNETDYPFNATLTFMNNQINPTTGSILMRAVFDNPKLPETGKAVDGIGPSAPAAAGSAPHAEASKAAPATATGSTAGKAAAAAPPKAAGEVDPAAAFIKMSTVRFDRQFAPGMFVRVRLPMGEPHPALLVIDRVIQSELGKNFVLVVDDGGVVRQREIKTGALQDNGLRVVEEGLKDDDWVVTGAIQQVKRGMHVTKEPRPMPTLNDPSPMPAAKDSSEKP